MNGLTDEQRDRVEAMTSDRVRRAATTLRDTNTFVELAGIPVAEIGDLLADYFDRYAQTQQKREEDGWRLVDWPLVLLVEAIENGMGGGGIGG